MMSMTQQGSIALNDAVGYQDGSVVSREMLKTEHGTVTFFAFDAGQGLSEHVAPFSVLLYVSEGTARVTIAGEENTVTAGQMIELPASKAHAVFAVEKFKMLLIMMR